MGKSVDARTLIEMALRGGFDLAGVCDAASLCDEGLREWLAAGRHGDMHYLEDHLDTREDPASRYEWMRGALVVALNYAPDRDATPGDGFGWSCYAWGDDYHRVLEQRLRKLAEQIRDCLPTDMEEEPLRYYVDTGPLSERLAAVKAGLGWIGKNGMMINQQKGSYLFLGMLLLPVDVSGPADDPANRCGSCRRCIEACPTDAIVADGVVDSNRCISYLNIEKRADWTPRDYAMLHDQFYGCDICQDVCPWNKFAVPTTVPELKRRPGYIDLGLSDIIEMEEKEYQNLFRISAMKRAKQAGLVRNAIAVAANTGRVDCLPAIESRLDSPLPGVPEAAAWARSVLVQNDTQNEQA